jgi:hypothetical protein
LKKYLSRVRARAGASLCNRPQRKTDALSEKLHFQHDLDRLLCIALVRNQHRGTLKKMPKIRACGSFVNRDDNPHFDQFISGARLQMDHNFAR